MSSSIYVGKNLGFAALLLCGGCDQGGGGPPDPVDPPLEHLIVSVFRHSTYDYVSNSVAADESNPNRTKAETIWGRDCFLHPSYDGVNFPVSIVARDVNGRYMRVGESFLANDPYAGLNTPHRENWNEVGRYRKWIKGVSRPADTTFGYGVNFFYSKAPYTQVANYSQRYYMLGWAPPDSNMAVVLPKEVPDWPATVRIEAHELGHMLSLTHDGANSFPVTLMHHNEPADTLLRSQCNAARTHGSNTGFLQTPRTF